MFHKVFRLINCQKIRPPSFDFSYNQTLLKNIGDTIEIEEGFSSTSPSILYDNDNNRMIICTRYVNYILNENKDFLYEYKGAMSDFIVTKNIISIFDVTNMEKWVKIEEFELDYNRKYNGLFIGIEDIRIFLSNKNELLFNGNRATTKIHGDYGIMTVEHGKIDLSQKKTIDTKLLLKLDYSEYNTNEKNFKMLTKEKNWVLFTDANGNTRMIYNWFPLQIGSLKDNFLDLSLKIKNNEGEPEQYNSSEFEILIIDKKIESPKHFKQTRGSSNGVRVGNEIWFLSHYVRYEMGFDYAHIFIVLDFETLELKKHSHIFTFEGERIEFSLGFVYLEEKNSFIIGYSKLDRDTNYIVIEKSVIDQELFS
jgi:hypothetical protein